MTQNPAHDTPMMRQYLDIKAQYPEEILFFRLGDFYEMFLKDAEIASRELDLTLTGRGKDEKRILMCGVPFHAADTYIAKLIERGYKVAICEQVEDPALSKGITKREVVQVITPGTVMNQTLLETKDHNFLAALYIGAKKVGFSFVDCSTGEFFTCDVASLEEAERHLSQLTPKEILIPLDFSPTWTLPAVLSAVPMLDPKRADDELCSFFKVNSLGAFGLSSLEAGHASAWAIVSYLKTTQKHALNQLVRCQPLVLTQTMQIDAATAQHLDLLTHAQTQDKKGSLLWVLDDTKTAVGGRKLKTWLRHPLTDKGTLYARYDAVEELIQDLLSREEIREVLKSIYDIERLISRIVSGQNNPKDCIALKDSLHMCLELQGILAHFSSPLLRDMAAYFKACATDTHPIRAMIRLIENALIETPPAVVRDGHFIKPGYSNELDQLQASFKDIKRWISGLEEQERTRTGIKSLKVGFNKVFGYYFQVPNSNREPIPADYIRKQTLTNAERYISPELKEKEIILLNGEEKQIELEITLYQQLVQQLVPSVSVLQEVSSKLGELDCLQSFATLSQKNTYTRPVLTDRPTLTLKESRHPVLEKKAERALVANDITLSEQSRFMLITGPNMAGKSTVMRQLALCVVMAQIGCFVPAKSAEIGLVDKLFTRIGATDNLYSGQSTFMVEMTETASILNNATSKSLILLDEIGRGTATYDGLSLAGAISEYLHNHIGARTCFATHYHELTQLSEDLPGFFNMNMGIEERDGELVFTYTLLHGAADKSYGIQVAKMAGLPTEVIRRATALLAYFETHHAVSNHVQMRLF